MELAFSVGNCHVICLRTLWASPTEEARRGSRAKRRGVGVGIGWQEIKIDAALIFIDFLLLLFWGWWGEVCVCGLLRGQDAIVRGINYVITSNVY